MARVLRTLLAVAAVAILLLFVWPRGRILIHIPISLGQAALLFGGAALVIFLAPAI